MTKRRSVFDITKINNKISVLDAQLQSDDVWQNPQNAAKISQELTELKNELSRLEKWQQLLVDSNLLMELYNESDDESLWEELQTNIEILEQELNKWEIERTLSGDYDTYDAILTVNAGAGGTDAQDWAQMLLRMYSRWAEIKGWSLELLDKSDGEEAGIKSATIKLSGKLGQKNLKITIIKFISPFKDLKTAESLIKNQITKFQTCIGCLACESVCKYNAIKITNISNKDEICYRINENKCVGCLECVKHFQGGCFMKKVLRTKKGDN